MSQIALVTDQHDYNVRIGMVSELLEPPRNVLVGLVLGNIVNQERSNGSTVVGTRNGTVALLSSSIPDLSLDRLGIDLDASGRKLDTDLIQALLDLAL